MMSCVRRRKTTTATKRRRSRRRRRRRSLVHLFSFYSLPADVFKQLNRSVDPCTDFYEFACGGWEKEHALKEGETRASGFSVLREKNYKVLKEELEGAKKNYAGVSRNVSVPQTHAYWQIYKKSENKGCMTVRLELTY